MFFFFQAEDGIRDLTVTGVQTCALPISSDVYWDEVVEIEPVGCEEVYDLTVDGLHNFVADDIVAHNSIERSEEHTSELQSQSNLVCRLLLEKKKRQQAHPILYIMTYIRR